MPSRQNMWSTRHAVSVFLLLALSSLSPAALIPPATTHRIVCRDGTLSDAPVATCDADHARNRVCEFQLHVPFGGSLFDVSQRVRVGHRKVYRRQEILMRCRRHE